MLTLKATIENERSGGFRWYAFIRNEPHPSTPKVNRVRNVGKLEPNYNGRSYRTCIKQIEKAAENMNAKLLRIDLFTRAILPDGRVGNIIDECTIWESE